ncbi:hypothetical protein COM97_27205 [Bacillus thuringiensis]|uniref:hypothetical protein n=1 Tax=Bacillus thuringiensis TaxID=1428 RepID=UPI000BED87D4|nr:hypothetical protein [Bacillus thuringiensis]PEF03431.1 hypothetical protein COM97_27205 [Bacillus thuringiensis]
MKEYAIQSVEKETQRVLYTFEKDEHKGLRPVVIPTVLVQMTIGSSTRNQRIVKRFKRSEWQCIKANGFVKLG